MERCSNCGAPAKSGAKFCTSCGARLVQRPEAGAGTWGGAHQEVDRGSTAWAWSDDAGKPAPDGDSGHPGDGEAAEAGVGQAEAVIDDGEVPEIAAGGDDAKGEAAGEDQSGGMEETPAWPKAEPDTSWATGWAAQYGAEGQESESSVEVEPEAERLEPVEDGQVNAESSGAADTNLDEFAQVDEDQFVQAEPATAATIGLETPQHDAGGGDPTERANALIDELRAVVSVLGSQQEAAGTTDMIALASELEAARFQPGESLAEEIEGLRTALDDARQRPRDVDTMLDLMGRLDVIIAMQDAHDRYAQAIDQAIQRLRGEGEEDGAGKDEPSEGDSGLPWRDGAG